MYETELLNCIKLGKSNYSQITSSSSIHLFVCLFVFLLDDQLRRSDDQVKSVERLRPPSKVSKLS